MQQEIGKLDQQIQDLEVESQKLKYQIQYYQTDSYKEKEARARLGLQAPGEGVVILPNSDDTKTQEEQAQQKRKKTNFEQWVNFLSGRGASWPTGHNLVNLLERRGVEQSGSSSGS